MTTRTTIYIDDDILERARRFVPPRGLSAMVSELLDEKISQLEQAEVEAAMREGYLARNSERDVVASDWQVVDSEGWPA